MQFRVARHTTNLKSIENFYTSILGLVVTGRFWHHRGYDGIFLGKDGVGWQLEFTCSKDVPDHQFDEDDLLVFYPESPAEYKSIIQAVDRERIERFRPQNPYWIENGICIKDPDGFRVIISSQRIKTKKDATSKR